MHSKRIITIFIETISNIKDKTSEELSEEGGDMRFFKIINTKKYKKSTLIFIFKDNEAFIGSFKVGCLFFSYPLLYLLKNHEQMN